MPHTRRWFAEDGVVFTSAVATTPVCCPTGKGTSYFDEWSVFTKGNRYFNPAARVVGSSQEDSTVGVAPYAVVPVHRTTEMTGRLREYYDLQRDPWQPENLLADHDRSTNPDLTRIARLLRAARTCRADSCR